MVSGCDILIMLGGLRGCSFIFWDANSFLAFSFLCGMISQKEGLFL